MRWTATARRAAASAVLLVLCCATVGGADAEPGGSASRTAADARSASSAREAAVEAARAGAPFGIPALPVYPPDQPRNDASNAYGATVGEGSTTVARSKTTIALPNVTLLSYLKVCLAIPLGGGLTIQTCCPDAFDLSTCPKSDIVDFPATSQDDIGGFNWNYNVGPVWVSSPAGSPTRFGWFPPVTVRLLAFGSVPSVATIQLRQPLGSDGFVSPINFRYLSIFGALSAGTTITGFPQAARDGDFYEQYLTLSGKLDVRITKLTVDGVGVDVGPNCQTSKPATLSYSGPSGFYSPDVPVTDLVGRPGGFQPLAGTGAGSFSGNIAIPSFAGCRDGNGRLDPLVTALASGARNRVQLGLSTPFQQCGSDVFRCPDYPTRDVKPAARAAAAGSRSAAAATAARGSDRGWSRLSSVQQDRAARALAALPASKRTAVLRTMPLDVVAAVRQVR